MKYINLYENFDWNEDDFDFEEELPNDIPYDFIGNELFYKFLVDEKILGVFIKNFTKSDWNPPGLRKYFSGDSGRNYIGDAFDWELSGYDIYYWDEINKKWLNTLRSNRR